MQEELSQCWELALDLIPGLVKFLELRFLLNQLEIDFPSGNYDGLGDRLRTLLSMTDAGISHRHPPGFAQLGQLRKFLAQSGEVLAQVPRGNSRQRNTQGKHLVVTKIIS